MGHRKICIDVFLDPAHVEQLDQICKKEEKTRSELIRKAVIHFYGFLVEPVKSIDDGGESADEFGMRVIAKSEVG